MRAKHFILTVLCSVILLGCKDKPVTPVLPFDKMREGDLAFRCGEGVFSRAVTAVEEEGAYSHVGVLVRDDGEWKVVHAVPGEKESARDYDRVKEERLEQFFAPARARKGCLVHVDGLTQDQAEEMGRAALLFARDSVRFDSQYNLQDSSRVYCTELVWLLFRRSGIDLSEGRRRYIKALGVQADCILPEHLYAYRGNELYFSF